MMLTPEDRRHDARVIACLSMHKTGSNSLAAALHDAGFAGVLRCHLAGPESIALSARVRGGASASTRPDPGLMLGARLAEPESLFTLVSCIREPVAQLVSTYFQFASARMRASGVEVPLTHEAFVTWRERSLPPDYPTWWFDDNFRTTLGFDFRSHPFDRERRSLRFDSRRLRLLVLRHEDSATSKEVELGWLVGRDRIMLPRLNVTANKPEAAAYADFLASFRPRRRWVEDLYDSELIRHVYTPDEREGFRRRWLPPGG